MCSLVRLIRLPALFLLVSSVPGFAQQRVQSVSGTVRDSAGSAIAGAEVLLGQRQTTTNAQGAFRMDSLRPGQYPITIRLVGYVPVRSRVEVVAGTQTELVYFLARAPFRLPTIVTEGHRTGIYGTVGDSGLRAVVGARVQVVGFQGGEAFTDSGGGFAFPGADQGTYLVRVTFPGYTERRLTLELERGKGRELAVRLTRGLASTSHGDEGAFQDLRLRLAMGFRRERLTAAGLERFGSAPLCEVPLEAGGSPVIIVNGVNVYRGMPRTFLCFWRADEVELVEFGPDVCREASHTLMFMLHVGCAGRSRGRFSAGGYIVIWERR